MKYLVGLTLFVLTAGPATAAPSLKNGRFLLAQQGVLIITARGGVVMARFLFGVAFGVGAILAWQSYGDQAKEAVVPWAAEKVMIHAPSLAWLVPGWTKGPSSRIDTAAKQTSPPPNRQVLTRQ